MSQKSAIAQFIMVESLEAASYYAPAYLKEEINNHFDKIVAQSKLSPSEVRENLRLVYTRIAFISDDQIPIAYYSRAAVLVRQVDVNDIVFVALAAYLNQSLWTGDRKLYRHLVKGGFQSVLNFSQLKKELGME